jgi:hypothetical protein
MANEIKKHPVFTDYASDIEGNCYSFKFGKIKELKKVKHSRGYHQLNLSIKGKKKMYLCHRLIYECFNGVIPKGLQVNHKDVDDKTNNHLHNLELATDFQNKQHAIANGVLYGTANPKHALYRN